MSFTRSVSWYAVLVFVVVAASWLWASPLLQEQVSAAGPLEQRAKPVTAQNRVPRLTRLVMPQNPGGSYWPPVGVTLRVTLDERGAVAEVRPLGPERERYSFYISTPMGGEVLAFTPLVDIVRGRPSYDAFVTAPMNSVRQWQYDPPVDGPIAFNVVFGFKPPSDPRLLSNGVTVDARAKGTAPAKEPPPPNGDLSPDWTQGAVRIGNEVNGPLKVKDVAVAYPPIAQSARVQGVVTLDVRVEPDGRVTNARVVEGPPLLRQAAFDAVMQWRFTPTILNGKPVPVVVTTTLEFTLMEGTK